MLLLNFGLTHFFLRAKFRSEMIRRQKWPPLCSKCPSIGSVVGDKYFLADYINEQVLSEKALTWNLLKWNLDPVVRKNIQLCGKCYSFDAECPPKVLSSALDATGKWWTFKRWNFLKWGLRSSGACPGKGLWHSGLLLCLFHFLAPWGKQLALPRAPAIMYCSDTSPKAMWLADHGLKLSKTVSQINLSFFKIDYLRYLLQ
jgi:hypothetical protein